MKKSFTLFIISFFCIASVLKAQSPQQMNYQAVVRNAAGTPLPFGTNVTVRFTIHDQTATGTAVFTEVNTAVTNQFGLITQIIGGTGNLSQVNWSSGPKYLQVEIDPNGGTNFTDMGTTQLLSVPYALYAGNAAAGPTGPTGVQGPQGNVGPAGATGPAGPQGVAGPQGATGTNGTNGIQGANGPQGPAGPTGSTGPAGAQGVPGLNGATGPAGPTGAGVAGPTGADGNTGPAGATGATGAQGTAGPTGATGPAGSQGPAGAQGPTGDPGAQGTPGAQGATGATGPQGSVGSAGPSGPQGAQGLPGATGPTGPQGNDGATGPTGSAGPQGAQGNQGTPGTNGATGATGPTGPAGSSASGNSQVSGSGGSIGVTWTNVRTVTIVKASSTTKLLIDAFVTVNTGDYEFSAGRIGYMSGSSYSSSSATNVTWAQGGAFDDEGAASMYSISTYITGLPAGTYTIGLDNDTDPDATIENSSLTVIEY